jgi:superfamily II DNA or RNA helicase
LFLLHIADDDDEMRSEEKKFEIRGYQEELVEGATQASNAVIVAPTGSGKTLVAAEIIKVNAKYLVILWSVERRQRESKGF